MLKDKSYFKKSTGDEAGAAPMKGVMTGVNAGKVYFIAWSMDVLIEGENVVRNLDMTTHNHASQGPNTPPMVYFDSVAIQVPEVCRSEADRANTACKGTNRAPLKKTEKGNMVDAGLDCSEPCKKHQKCILIPKSADKQACCAPDTTGHHLLPNSLLQGVRDASNTNVVGLKKAGPDAYTCEEGPCVCVAGGSHDGDHGKLHEKTKEKLRTILMAGKELTYRDCLEKVAEAHAEVFQNPDTKKPQCNPECTKAQIDAALANAKTGSEIQVLQKDGVSTMKFDRFKIGEKD